MKLLSPLKRCTKCKEWKQATPDYFYRKGGGRDGLVSWCKICFKEAVRRRYRANPERSRERSREGSRRWREARPERARRKHGERVRRRRALKAGAEGTFTEAEFLALCELHGGRCLACGRTDLPLQRDHVVPLSRGGRNDISNIQPLCQQCNDSKGTESTDYRRKDNDRE